MTVARLESTVLGHSNNARIGTSDPVVTLETVYIGNAQIAT